VAIDTSEQNESVFDSVVIVPFYSATINLFIPLISLNDVVQKLVAMLY